MSGFDSQPITAGRHGCMTHGGQTFTTPDAAMTPRAALREALDKTAAAIDDPARFTEVHHLYRAGWVDALRAVRDDPALASSTQDAAHNHPRDDRYVVEGCPACPWPPETASTQDALDVEALREAISAAVRGNRLGSIAATIDRDAFAQSVATEYAAIRAARGQQ